MKKHNYKKVIPNIITLFNLSLGVIAILLAAQNDSIIFLINASLIVMVAAMTDRLDGKVARILGATSELGKELDSLSDLISFGVAPIIICWKISLMKFGFLGYLIAIVFPIAGSYRLARYNITKFDNFFKGVPITIAGLFLTIINLYNCVSILNNKHSIFNSYSMIIIIVCLAFSMVSKFNIKKV